MVFKTGYNVGLGATVFTSVDTAAMYALGAIVKGLDDVFGEGEFIYLPGLALTAAGDAVVWDLLPAGQTTTRTLVATHANSGRSVGFAMAATIAATFGWYQIAGVATVNATAATAIGKCMLTATAGSVNSAAVAGSQLLNATISSAVGTPSAGKCYVTCNRPNIQSQIT